MTLPEIVTVHVASLSSVHVAPGSVNPLPTYILIVDAHERVITGGVVSGARVTVTVRVTPVAELFATSFAEYSRT